MKKRFLPLLLALLLALALPAQAESAFAAAADAVLPIYLRTDAGDTLLGSGVAFIRNDTLLTVESCVREGELVVLASDGEHRVTDVRVEDNGAALLTMEPPLDATPVVLADYSISAAPYVLGVAADGARTAETLYQALMGYYRGEDALVLSSEDGLLPGAVALDENGALVCIAVGRNGEGVGMYTALEIAGLYSLSLDLADVSGTDPFYVKADLRWQGGALNVDWPDSGRTDGIYYITVSGQANCYYSSYTARADEAGLSLILPPGHTYDVQVQWSPDKASVLPVNWYAMQQFAVPDGVYTDYGFTSRCYVSALSAGSAVPKGLFPETDFLSVDMVTGGAYDLYFQTIAEYQVTEELYLPMTAELIAPDGQFYFIDLEYHLNPAYNDGDVCYLLLEDLFAECAEFSDGSVLAPGAYRLRYAIAGKTAAEFAFTLAAEGASAPETTSAVPAAGLLTGYTVTSENGQITLDWSNLPELPAGDNLTYVVFVQYGDNTYYSYYKLDAATWQETHCSIPSVPGVDSIVWLGYAYGGGIAGLEPQTREEYVVVPADEKQPCTINGFTHVRASLTVADAAAASSGAYLPEVPLTRALLTDRTLPVYFQTEDTYSVTEESGDYPLLIVLYTPDGGIYTDESSYLFMPDLCGGDFWTRDLEELLSFYESMAGASAWPAGEYTVGYYIGGFVADEFTFTLE